LACSSICLADLAFRVPNPARTKSFTSDSWMKREETGGEDVAQAFQPAGSGDFPVARKHGTGKSREPADLEVCATAQSSLVNNSALHLVARRATKPLRDEQFLSKYRL